jgi:hypothetical protein
MSTGSPRPRRSPPSLWGSTTSRYGDRSYFVGPTVLTNTVLTNTVLTNTVLTNTVLTNTGASATRRRSRS